jgi:hypothetical protein
MIPYGEGETPEQEARRLQRLLPSALEVSSWVIIADDGKSATLQVVRDERAAGFYFFNGCLEIHICDGDGEKSVENVHDGTVHATFRWLIFGGTRP